MHFQYLIEDQSSKTLIDQIMTRTIKNADADTYNCKSFKGIGGFTKKNTVKEMHTGKLLNDLATYMRGFQRSLQGIEAVLVVVLDNDDNDPSEFEKELHEVAMHNRISMDHVFCIAIEEMEAWLLGDEEAIKSAYPYYKKNILNSYEQDSICGTWEVLADVIYRGGLREIKKKKFSYMEIGKLKSEWATKIGRYMTYENNKSPSFQKYYESIVKRVT